MEPADCPCLKGYVNVHACEWVPVCYIALILCIMKFIIILFKGSE